MIRFDENKVNLKSNEELLHELFESQFHNESYIELVIKILLNRGITTSDIFKDISTDDLVVSYCFDREKYKIPYIQLVKEELLNRNYDLSTIPDLTPKQEDIPASNGRSIRYIVILSIIFIIILIKLLSSGNDSLDTGKSNNEKLEGNQMESLPSNEKNKDLQKTMSDHEKTIKEILEIDKIAYDNFLKGPFDQNQNYSEIMLIRLKSKPLDEKKDIINGWFSSKESANMLSVNKQIQEFDNYLSDESIDIETTKKEYIEHLNKNFTIHPDLIEYKTLFLKECEIRISNIILKKRKIK